MAQFAITLDVFYLIWLWNYDLLGIFLICGDNVEYQIVQDGNRVGSVKQQLSSLFEASLRATFPELNIEPMVAACTAKFGDYQWYDFSIQLSNIWPI